MQRVLKMLIAAAAASGLALASTTAMAQAPAKPDPKAEAAKKTDAAKADATKKMEAPKEAAKPEAKKELMDINSASEKDLASLKGIGEARAKAIVKGRPYKGKDDLVKNKVIPEGVYNDIKDQIIAKQDMAKAEPKKEEKKK
jgi:competence protein ComEA